MGDETTRKSKKILVVDNNPVMLKLMEKFLVKEGHDVTLSDDAFSAFDVIKKMTPDIIFIDLVLPRVSGGNLCRIFRDLNHLKDCHLIIVSAIAIEQKLDFINMGADGCIAKGPFNLMIPYLRDAIVESDNPRQPGREIIIKGADNIHARQVTKELLSQSHHLNIILESISQGVLEIMSHRVVFFNKAALFLLKTTHEHLLGSSFRECFEEGLRARIETIIDPDRQRSRSEMETATVEMNDRHVIFQCIRVEQGTDHFIILLTDITERKQMESVIEATNLAENLGYIFSGIRHEIGNPVGSIKMALGVLKRNLETYDTKTVSEFVDRSLEEVGRIEYLLKELKNYSLFESPDVKKIRLDTFMDNFISLVKDDFEKRHLEIRTKIDKDIKYAFIDNRALHHIMLNLMTNSADAVEKISSGLISIRVKNHPPWVKIKVADNGIGISEADQKNLFKPFFTSKAKGTGLGLVIVKKMLLKMNSTISVESREGSGTEITLKIPIEESS